MWPERALSPNARVHYLTKAQATRKAKVAAYNVARQAFGMEAITMKEGTLMGVTFRCYPPCKRRRDEDNFLASMKATLDGIAWAAEVNDVVFHFREQEWGDIVRPCGLVEVILDWDDGRN